MDQKKPRRRLRPTWAAQEAAAEEGSAKRQRKEPHASETPVAAGTVQAGVKTVPLLGVGRTSKPGHRQKRPGAYRMGPF